MPSDNFTRANSGTLGANWTDIAYGHQIVSNTCRGVTAGQYNLSIWTANSWNANHDSQITLLASWVSVGPIVRAANNGGADGYLGMAHRGGNYRRIYRIDNGSLTQIAADDGTLTAGDTIRLEALGSSINYYQNGGAALIITPDATYGSGSPGVNVVGDSSVVGLGDWVGTGEISDSPYQILKLSGVGNNLASPGFLLRP